MEERKGARRPVYKRCPACGSRVESTEPICEICGHVFGETQAIPKAEMEAALRRERERAAEAGEEAKADTSAAGGSIKSGPNSAAARRDAGAAASARMRARATQRNQPARQRPEVPWGVLGVVAVIIAVLGGGVYLLSRSVIGGDDTPSGRAGTPTAVGALRDAPKLVVPTQIPTFAAPALPTVAPVFPTRTPVPPGEYTIVAGDTCSQIAQRFSVPYSEFLRINNLNDTTCTRIQLGDKVLIPPPPATPGPSETPAADVTPQPQPTLAANLTHEVKSGDTCSTIAERYQISVDDIIRQNPDLNLNQQCLIQVGVKLNISRAGAAVIAEATAYVISAPTSASSYAAPVALVPVDNAKIDAAAFSLEWLSVGALKANEWYVVQIQPAGAITVPIFETKETSIRLSGDLIAGETERSMSWWVQVRQKVGTMASGQPVYNDLSPVSNVRRFTLIRPRPTSTPLP